jgi:hypothetical protein
MKVLTPVNASFIEADVDLSTLSLNEVEAWEARYYQNSYGVISGVYRISELLEFTDWCKVNRLWHIAIVRGRQLEAYTVHVGNHQRSPQIYDKNPTGCGWLYSPGSHRMLTTCFNADGRRMWEEKTGFSLTELPASDPQDAEIEI